MNRNSTARWVNVLFGVWLFISAFVWTHSSSQFTNAWIVGLAAAAFAGIATRFKEARYANAALAVWLFVSVWALPTPSVATMWNHIIVSVLMFFFALMPSTYEPTTVQRANR